VTAEPVSARTVRAETVIVIAKEPVPGRVKTRLQQRFTAEQAAGLAVACLADTFAAVQAAPLARRIVALDGAAGSWLPPGVDVISQGPGGLDQRLDHAFEHAFGITARRPRLPSPRRWTTRGPVLLIGMDTPQVTADLLASDWGDADAVLGLSPDGGFWAAGLRRYVPGAFTGVPMSTPHTGAAQHERFRSLGLRVRLLPGLLDVDTPADAQQVAQLAPATRFATEHRRLTSAPAPGVLRPVAEEHPLQLFAAALDGQSVRAELPDGQSFPLEAARWTGSPDSADLMMLSRCEGAVLDLGCGPGRLVGALAASGAVALGVDVSPAAVRHTAGRGASVLLRSIHDRLPAEGRWGTVLLADGNIGIGGDPGSLLRRCASLLRPMGLLLAEADPDDGLNTREQVRLVTGSRRSAPIPWARLGCPALAMAADRAGFGVYEEWRAGGRVFLALRSPARS
jgi:glycosyltransferase A (GT-A) superfamily protein (DUF2064 family)/SAM-dependent methyltransferase